MEGRGPWEWLQLADFALHPEGDPELGVAVCQHEAIPGDCIQHPVAVGLLLEDAVQHCGPLSRALGCRGAAGEG